MHKKMAFWFSAAVASFSLAFGMANAQFLERPSETVNLEQLLTECRHIDCTLKPIERASRSYKAPRKQGAIFQGADAPSVNWSGYVAVAETANGPNPTFNSVSSVQGGWVVPTLTVNPDGDTYSSAWVGIDGYTNDVVEQIGTEHDIAADGTLDYYAWVELYPLGAQLIEGFPVNPGDEILASVQANNLYDFKFKITNLTQNASSAFYLSTPPDSPAHLSCAEWIVEAPATLLDGIEEMPSGCVNILPLANFSTIPFRNCQATINGKNRGIENDDWTFVAITMTTGSPDNIVKAIPSKLKTKKNKGSKFDIIWQNAGELPYQTICPLG